MVCQQRRQQTTSNNNNIRLEPTHTREKTIESRKSAQINGVNIPNGKWKKQYSLGKLYKITQTPLSSFKDTCPGMKIIFIYCHQKPKNQQQQDTLLSDTKQFVQNQRKKKMINDYENKRMKRIRKKEILCSFYMNYRIDKHAN